MRSCAPPVRRSTRRRPGSTAWSTTTCCGHGTSPPSGRNSARTHPAASRRWTDVSTIFLDLPGAVDGTGIDAGVPAHYGNPALEQRALASGQAVVDLSHRAVLSLTGPDRLTWLDSISSQALKGLQPGESSETLILDPNGRIEHVLRLIDDGVTLWILVERTEVDALVAWLNRMKFMMQVEIADRSDQFKTIGTLGSPELPAAAPNGVPLVWVDSWPLVRDGGHQYAA